MYSEAVHSFEKGLTMEPTEGEKKALQVEIVKCKKLYAEQMEKVKNTYAKMMNTGGADVDWFNDIGWDRPSGLEVDNRFFFRARAFHAIDGLFHLFECVFDLDARTRYMVVFTWFVSSVCV